jgi:hypothetical protein
MQRVVDADEFSFTLADAEPLTFDAPFIAAAFAQEPPALTARSRTAAPFDLTLTFACAEPEKLIAPARRPSKSARTRSLSAARGADASGEKPSIIAAPANYCRHQTQAGR